VTPSIMGNAIVSLGKSDSLGKAKSTLYHEMAHVLGLPDSSRDPNARFGNAYDVGFASEMLDRDIRLPNQSGITDSTPAYKAYEKAKALKKTNGR
jgi:hypothetical protein